MKHNTLSQKTNLKFSKQKKQQPIPIPASAHHCIRAADVRLILITQHAYASPAFMVPHAAWKSTAVRGLTHATMEYALISQEGTAHTHVVVSPVRQVNIVRSN